MTRGRRKRNRILIFCLIISFLLISGYLLSMDMNEEERATQPAGPALEYIDVEVLSDHLIVMDLDSDKVLYEKAAGEQTRPASLAKMMTALVIIENTENFHERIAIPHDIYTYLDGSGIAVAGFKDGEAPTVRDLLYGILYQSGADCCLTLAQKVSGSEAQFVELMNEKAAEIGMNDTNFGNPIGLDNPPCYTTVSDMAELTKYALENKTFREIFTSYTYTIEPTNKYDKPRDIKNAAIKRFSLDRAGVFGGKLGNTFAAQLCLVTVAEIEGREYICVSTHAERTARHYNPHVEDARTVYNEIKKASDLQSEEAEY